MTGDLARRPERFYAFGPFRLMPERQLLMRGETPIRIGSRALDILQVLLDCAGEVVGKRELLSRVWPDMSVEEGNLKTNIAVLRRALGDETGKATYIATVTGRATDLSRAFKRAKQSAQHQLRGAAIACQPGQRASLEGRMRSTSFDAIWKRCGSYRSWGPAASARRRWR
jgi:DNA-binding winged helix-turn-helix (wHTH) protein